MPRFNPEDPLAIPQLFQHQFDIDDVLRGLCGVSPCWLRTTDGTVHATQPEGPASHVFMLEPLPPSFVATLGTHPDLRLLNPHDQEVLRQLLPTLTIPELAPRFADGTRLGGWLRERVKEAALDWLDLHGLIPPSMRHINRRTEPVGVQAGKISIRED